jgi:hypothetical protein
MMWLLLFVLDAALLFPFWLIVGGGWWWWIGAAAFLATTGYAVGRAAAR